MDAFLCRRGSVEHRAHGVAREAEVGHGGPQMELTRGAEGGFLVGADGAVDACGFGQGIQAADVGRAAEDIAQVEGGTGAALDRFQTAFGGWGYGD